MCRNLAPFALAVLLGYVASANVDSWGSGVTVAFFGGCAFILLAVDLALNGWRGPRRR